VNVTVEFLDHLEAPLHYNGKRIKDAKEASQKLRKSPEIVVPARA